METIMKVDNAMHECPFLDNIYDATSIPQSHYPCQPGLEYKLEF